MQNTIGKVRTGISSYFNYSKNNQFIQQRQSVNERFIQTYTPEIRTNFSVAPNIRIRYRYSITNNNQGLRETKFITRAPSVDFDAYIIEKFTFKTYYSYTVQDQIDEGSQSFQIWNASLAFKKDKETKWEFEIRGSNLLNVSSQIRNNANSVSVFNSTTFIQPRFITIRAVYQL